MASNEQEALTAFFSPIQAVERVLYPHLSTYWTNLQAVLDDYSVSNAQVKADGHKVYGAILVSARPCHPLLPASAQLAHFRTLGPGSLYASPSALTGGRRATAEDEGPGSRA